MGKFALERVLHQKLAKTCGTPKDDDRLLEIGTGWLHWEAVTTRLFFNIHGILFDVWDNRQINGLKNYLGQLDKMIDKLDADEIQKISAHQLISQIIKVGDYHDLYRLLGFEYALDIRGRLNLLDKESFDIVVSAGVLEHVRSEDVHDFVQDIALVLKPNGYSIHSINIRDHLYQYDNTVSPKQYLKYPDWAWKLCFENRIQYINRIQRSDWLALFEKAGFVLIEEDDDFVNMSGMKVAMAYQGYSQDDLQCCSLKIVHYKPS